MAAYQLKEIDGNWHLMENAKSTGIVFPDKETANLVFMSMVKLSLRGYDVDLQDMANAVELLKDQATKGDR